MSHLRCQVARPRSTQRPQPPAPDGRGHQISSPMQALRTGTNARPSFSSARISRTRNGRSAPCPPLRRKRRRPQIRRNRRRRPPIGCQRRRTEFQSGRFETTRLRNEASARGGISERALGWWFWGLTATCFRRQQQHLTRFSGDRIGLSATTPAGS
jgi:hypothetical protein